MIRTVLFWGTFALIMVVAFIADLFLSPFINRKEIYCQVERYGARVLLWIGGIRVEVSGVENLAGLKNVLYVSNHQSGVDMFIYMACLPITVQIVIMRQVYKLPILRDFLKRGGQVMVDMRDSHQAFLSVEKLLKRLREGESFFIFPEGTRSPDSRLLEFKQGAAMMVLGAKKPVVPIAIIDSYKVMQRDDLYGLRVRPGKVRVVVGKPVTFSEYPEMTVENARLINAKLKETIAGLMQEGFQPSL